MTTSLLFSVALVFDRLTLHGSIFEVMVADLASVLAADSY